MKNQKEIYDEINHIIDERNKLNRQLQNIDEELINMQEQCSHKIVLAFDDCWPRKRGGIVQCFCPACGKNENIHSSYTIGQSTFKNSKLVDLTSVPMSTFDGYFYSIRNHIFDNYDYYYSDDVSNSEIAKSILSLVATEKEKKLQKK